MNLWERRNFGDERARNILWLIYASILALIAWLIFGCASMRTTCEYSNEGRLLTYSLHSTVVGTGETEVISTDCAALAYSTEDTGLSDNGKDALGEIAEGSVRGLVPAP